MTIIRDGKEIALTDEELKLAWYEGLRRSKIEDMRNTIWCSIEYLYDRYGKAQVDAILADEDKLYAMQQTFDNYFYSREDGDFEFDCLIDTFNDHMNEED